MLPNPNKLRPQHISNCSGRPLFRPKQPFPYLRMNIQSTPIHLISVDFYSSTIPSNPCSEIEGVSMNWSITREPRPTFTIGSDFKPFTMPRRIKK